MAPLHDAARPDGSVAPSFDLVTREHCLHLLDATTVGRIAFVGSAGVVLLPVNYRVIGESVVLRVSTSGALGQLVDLVDEAVFEVDYHSSTSRAGWSVIVRGQVSVVPDAHPLPAEELARLVPWAACSGPTTVLTLPTRRLTGRIV